MRRNGPRHRASPEKMAGLLRKQTSEAAAICEDPRVYAAAGGAYSTEGGRAPPLALVPFWGGKPDEDGRTNAHSRGPASAIPTTAFPRGTRGT